MNNDITKQKWEKLHSESRFRPKYPHEMVVQWLFHNFKRDGKEKVLDLGCGAGRHVLLMGRENVIPYGVDVSTSGVEYTQALLRNNGLEKFANNVLCNNFTSLPFPDNFFNGIIAFGTLYYVVKADVNLAVKEIYRTLSCGGALMCFVRGTSDYRFGQGKEIEKNTFLIKYTDTKASAFAEDGMIMHFFEKAELQEMFREFQSVTIDTVAISSQNGKLLDFNYLVQAVK